MEQRSPYTAAIDTHNEEWERIEAEVQRRAIKKDHFFIIGSNSSWTIEIFLRGEFTVRIVDVEWVRNNLNCNFGHGGHGWVYEFIPLNEIWVSDKHSSCICLNVKEGQPVSNIYRERCILHEITEARQMSLGKSYWEAHNIALQAEKMYDPTRDPYEEIPLPDANNRTPNLAVQGDKQETARTSCPE